MSLFSIAARSLQENIISLPSGKYVSAGQNQFLTLWTRDFCHAVRGLLVIGEEETAKNHLSYLLKNKREDGLVPRVVDNHLVQFRVAYQTGRKLLPMLPKLTFKEPLKPQFKDEHGSEAIDSNLLVLLASLMVKETKGGEEWWQSHREDLLQVFRWYDSKFTEGLIHQMAFSDWQDSVKREGHTFLTNLFYYLAAARLEKFGFEMKINLGAFRERIQNQFFRNGLYHSFTSGDHVSLDGNLFALEAEEFLDYDEKRQLWKKLLRHPMARHGLGVCSYPEYSKSDIAWHVKFANLHGYHTNLAWSWLMGLGLKVAFLMTDDHHFPKQLNLIKFVLERDQVVMELYDPNKNWKPWESWLLKAEHPFAWGSGYLLEALHFAGIR